MAFLFLSSCLYHYVTPVGGMEDDAALHHAAMVTNDARFEARRHLYENAGLDVDGWQLQTLRTDRFNLQFSHNGHFYTEDIFVEITVNPDIEGAVIYFTTDGSYPVRGRTSQTNRRYTGPIMISAGDFNAPTVLRARAFLCDEVYSNILTHTYFVSAEIYSRFDPNTYVFSLSSDPVNLWDHDRGILVAGRLREDFIRNNPGRNIVPPDPANFNVRGREGERPAYVQVFNYRGELIISQSIGIRVRGGWSRQASRQSLGLYARHDYDPVFDRFHHDFFRFFDDISRTGRTTVRGTDIPVDTHRMIVLRNGGNDRNGAHMREELSQVLLRQAGFLDYKGIAPAAMFLNGTYRGFYWLQNMYPIYYFFDHYGDFERSLIEDLRWYEVPHNMYQLVCTYNLMQHFAFQIYISNRDWPHNNLRYWRFNGEGGESINRYFDGLFRLLPYDLEMAWGMFGQGYRERTIGRARGSNVTFDTLLRQDEMVEKFCNQMWDLINSVFVPANVHSIFDRLVELNDYEINFAIRRNTSSTNRNQLQNERRSILQFADNRADIVIDDMRRTFRLSGDVYYIEVIGAAGTMVRLNTLESFGARTLTANYFVEHSVVLSNASPRFDYWIINGIRYDTPIVMLDSSMAQFGHITAQLFLRQ